MKLINMLALALLLAGAAQAAGDKKAAVKAAGKDAWKARTFTAEELKKFNGQDGMPAYAAVDGVVYDLSKSKYWKTGTHMKQHEAGADLSDDIHNKAPKGIHKDGKILNKMPKVGVLKGYVLVRAALKGEVGKEAVCPVSGETFKVAKDTLAADYKGKAYYFCCAGCDKAFSKDPEIYAVKYVNK
jgi:predicted heme/steroid binding protein/YHS domain-containing protein